MPLSSVRNIPAIMNKLGWSMGADLLNNWFNTASHNRSTTGITKPEFDNAYSLGALTTWLLNQPEGKVVWEKIFNRHLWRSTSSSDGDAVTRLGKLLDDQGILKPGIKNVPFGKTNFTAKDYERTRTFLNVSSYKTGPTTELTACVAALGSFVLKIALNGKVSHTPGMVFSNVYTVTPESLDIYLWDAFDFIDDGVISQPLGCWDETTNTVSKFPGEGKVCVDNSSFRQWRTANNMGGDFYVFSDVHKQVLTRPSDLETFEISKP